MTSTTDEPTRPNSNKSREPGPLDFTHKPFGGLVLDMKRRYPYWVSDWVDAFRVENLGKVIAAVFFLFFAVVVPPITFGNLYESDTDGSFGVVETLLATGVNGVLYTIVAGQPITMLGASGPMFFAYTKVCYDLSVQFEVEFFPFYFWTMSWCSVILLLFVMCDLCALLRHVTPFSQDIFSGLVSFIFIIQSCTPMLENFTDGVKPTPVAFLELVLFSFTFQCATVLSGLRRTRWMNGHLRAGFTNFAVSVAIAAGSALKLFWDDIEVDMLTIAGTLRPTYEKDGIVRSWFVAPMGENGDFPMWAIFFAFVPAAGLAVLTFLDQILTDALVNRPSRKLKKPGGYHLDLFIRAVVSNPVSAIFGLPCSVAATLPSVTHLMALTTYTTEEFPDGTERKVPEKVVEQRLSGLLISALVGASLFLAPALAYVPRCVLWGIFLFMGVRSLEGNALVERLLLWCIWDPMDYPAFDYVQNVPIRQTHLFTLLQAVCLGILNFVKSNKKTGFAFPFLLASLAIVRKSFKYLFTEDELRWLDDPEVDMPDEEEEMDGYDIPVSKWAQDVQDDLGDPDGVGVAPSVKIMRSKSIGYSRGDNPLRRGATFTRGATLGQLGGASRSATPQSRIATPQSRVATPSRTGTPAGQARPARQARPAMVQVAAPSLSPGVSPQPSPGVSPRPSPSVSPRQPAPIPE